VRERFSSSVHRGDACVRHRLVAGSIGVGSVERSKRPKSEHIHLSATRSAHFTAFARYDKCIWMQGRKCIHDMVMDNRGGGGPMQRARSLQRALSSINGRASSPLTKLSHLQRSHQFSTFERSVSLRLTTPAQISPNAPFTWETVGGTAIAILGWMPSRSHANPSSIVVLDTYSSSSSLLRTSATPIIRTR
jgi:hypothetical protein